MKSLKIPHTQRFLKEKIFTHPHYPSLLSIADTLEEYGIGSVAVKLGPEKLDAIPLPTVVQVSSSNGSYFFNLTEVSEERVAVFNEKGEPNELSRADFLEIWTGICLIIESKGEAAEPGIKKKNRDGQIITAVVSLFVINLLIWLGFVLVSGWNSWSSQADVGFFSSYFLLKLFGLITSGILLWYQEDRGNPALQKFCSAGKRVDCDQVLDSKTFQALGGRINPALITFAYFFASLVLLSASSLVLVAWLSLLTIPVVVLSFYYQFVVLRKWCKFCLLIQGVLVSEVVAVFFGSFWAGNLTTSGASIFLAIFTGTILTFILVKPLLGKGEEVYAAKRELAKLKSNRALFEAALSRSRKIKTEPDGIGILIRANKPKYKVIKVCNPYCGPCSRVHPELEALFERGNIDLQILFTPAEGDGQKEMVIRHLLAVDGIGTSENTRRALSDWYSADNKDYSEFAAKYPMNGELAIQSEKIRMMENWCYNEQISYTPTLFINGFELPSEYSIRDLKYILD